MSQADLILGMGKFLDHLLDHLVVPGDLGLGHGVRGVAPVPENLANQRATRPRPPDLCERVIVARPTTTTDNTRNTVVPARWQSGTQGARAATRCSFLRWRCAENQIYCQRPPVSLALGVRQGHEPRRGEEPNGQNSYIE